MRQEKKICPICGIKMKSKAGDYVCSDCGYHASYGGSSANASYGTTSSYGAGTGTNTYTKTTGTQGTGTYTKTTSGIQGTSAYTKTTSGTQGAGTYTKTTSGTQGTGTYTKTTSGTYARPPKRKKTMSIVVILLVFIIWFIAPVLFFFVQNSVEEEGKDIFRKLSEQLDGENSRTDYEYDSAINNSSGIGSVYSSDDGTDSEEDIYTVPQTPIFQQFVTEVFGKEYSSVTPEELKKVTSICTRETEDTGYFVMEYTLEDGTKGDFYYDNVYFDTSDIRCFIGLQQLHVEDKELNEGDLNGLTKLTDLGCGNEPLDLVEIIDASQIEKLILDSDLFMRGTTGIDAFTNLKELTINAYFLEDITGLSTLKNLKKLDIQRAERVENYGELYQLTQLESLAVDGQNLRDIGFVSNMKALKELSIHNSEILSVDALADCKDTLEKLDLTDNYQVADYNVVTQLTKLKELTLFIASSGNHDLTLPDLSGAKSLTSLSISCYDDISSLAKLTGLEELTLSRIYDDSAIPALPNLKTLRIWDVSVFDDMINSISQLSSLEVVDLTGSFIWTDINHIFSLPKIQEVYLVDCTAGLNIATLPTCESLQVLRINNASLRQLQNGEWEYFSDYDNSIRIADQTEMFAKFPGLKHLEIVGVELADVNFVKDLKQLEILDITNNYVTDVTPLNQISTFRHVLCATNPVVQDDGEGGKILMEN